LYKSKEEFSCGWRFLIENLESNFFRGKKSQTNKQTNTKRKTNNWNKTTSKKENRSFDRNNLIYNYIQYSR
jgi:hypothetical protein